MGYLVRPFTSSVHKAIVLVYTGLGPNSKKAELICWSAAREVTQNCYGVITLKAINYLGNDGIMPNTLKTRQSKQCRILGG